MIIFIGDYVLTKASPSEWVRVDEIHDNVTIGTKKGKLHVTMLGDDKCEVVDYASENEYNKLKDEWVDEEFTDTYGEEDLTEDTVYGGQF